MVKPALRRLWIFACCALLACSAALLVRRWTGWDPRDLLRIRPEFADAVVRLELELDLCAPPRFAAKARLALREGTQGRVRFLLNRDLEMLRATDESGRELAFEDEGRLRSDYYEEARVVGVDLPAPARELRLEYAGEGLDGSAPRDWMGVLMLTRNELRMSKQTVFYPQVPEDLDGPSPRPWPARLRVLAPAGFEAYAPGAPAEWPDAPAGGRAWCWESDTPTVLSFFAAPRVRRETRLGDAVVVTLLREEHAALGESLALEVERMLRAYTALWGPVGGRTLGIVEMKSRGKSSYNWTSTGIIAMESGALGGGVPQKTLAHEVAHLWWGQETCARGRGERFLTEGLAEYAAWRFVAIAQGAAAAEEAAREAEAKWWSSVHETGADPALLDVRFASPGYQELAYAKGPVALWNLQRQLGEERLDAVLRDYRERSRSGGGESGEQFLAALRASGGALDLSLLEQAGHAHLEIAEAAIDGSAARGRVQLARCPEGLPAPRIEELMLAVHTADAVTRESVRVGASFEIRAPGAIQALEIDPVGVLPGARPAPVLSPGIGLVSSEPHDGADGIALGPFVARLRFGAALRAPAEGFAKEVERASVRRAIADETAIFSVLSAGLEEEGRTLALEIADTSPAKAHLLVVPDGLATARGIPLPPLELRFTVRDATGAPRPRLVASEPPADARDVSPSLRELRIVFSEPMRRGRGFKTPLVEDLEDEGWIFPRLGESRWEDPRTLVWELEAPLERGRRYGLPFSELYKSQLGIALERFDLRFETAR